MNFDSKLILFCIIFLNLLHSVYLATLKTQPVSSPLPTASPVDSTQTLAYRKMKPICGPVPFPEYSCEDIRVLQSKQISLKGTTVWKPTDDFLKAPDPTAEPIYGLPEYVSQSSLLPQNAAPHIRQDITDVAPAYQEKTLANAFPHSVSLYGPFETFVTESLPKGLEVHLFDEIPKDKIIQNPKGTSARSISSRGISYNTKGTSYYSSTPRPAATRSALRQKLEVVQRMIRTKSTYPFFPEGTTPEKDPEPTELLMCGIAKCLQLSWKDPSDAAPGPGPAKQVLHFRATSPKQAMKKVIGFESPPLQNTEDTYYFNEDI